MRNRITAGVRRGTQTFGSFSAGQKAVTLVAIVALAVGGYFFATWASAPTYAPLFSNLALYCGFDLGRGNPLNRGQLGGRPGLCILDIAGAAVLGFAGGRESHREQDDGEGAERSVELVKETDIWHDVTMS